MSIRDQMRASPLHVAAFRRLATTYTLNELSWGFGTIALAVLVFDRTGSALATTLLFLGTTFFPALIAPALTARLDQLPVRRALPALYLCEAALFAGLAVLSGRFWLPAVIVLALADGAIAIVGRGLTRAAVAAALEPSGTLAAGNKLLNVCFSIAYATGPGIAGIVSATGGPGASLAITAGLFTAMAVALATCRTLPEAHGTGDRSWRTRLVEGLRYVRGERTVRAVLVAHGVALAFLSLGMPIEVVYVKSSLGAGDMAYGLLLAAWGAGTVLSSVVLARVPKSSPLVLIPLTAAAMGGGYLVMAVSPSVAIAALGCLVGGMGNGIYYVSVVQAIQERVAEDFQARVMGLLESTNAACYGLGFLVGGLVTAVFDARLAFGLAAGGVLVAAAVIRMLLRRHGAPRAAASARRVGAVEPAAG
jgi:predicted MFS family arabinose efflux permease